MTIEFPWPEPPERVLRRVRGIVMSLLNDSELEDVRLDWVTPEAHQRDSPAAAWVALRVTVVAVANETFQREVCGPDWFGTWEEELGDLANDLEDWVCETPFAWGQERRATVPS